MSVYTVYKYAYMIFVSFYTMCIYHDMCIYIYTARTDVLPGEVRFDCARPVFYAFWDVGQLATWLTRFVSKAQNPKPKP